MVSTSYLMVFFLFGFACDIGVGVEMNKKGNCRANNDRE